MTQARPQASPPTAPAGIIDQRLIIMVILVGTMIALAMTRQIDGATVADFVKWVAIVYWGGVGTQGAAQKIALGQAVQSSTIEAAHRELLMTELRR